MSKRPAAAPKKVVEPKHECIMFAVDVGSNSAMTTNGKETDLEQSHRVLDWVISRKVLYTFLFFIRR
jgi:hypothetical protein